jgi:hypothetical protein
MQDRASGDGGAGIVGVVVIGFLIFVFSFGVVDIGRAYSLKSRLADASREGAAIAQIAPGNVDSGCANGDNVVDRATNSDIDLRTVPGFSVTIGKQVDSTVTRYTGCETPDGTTVSSGDTLVVTAQADFSMLTPVVGSFLGNTLTVSRSTTVVAQG